MKKLFIFLLTLFSIANSIYSMEQVKTLREQALKKSAKEVFNKIEAAEQSTNLQHVTCDAKQFNNFFINFGLNPDILPKEPDLFAEIILEVTALLLLRSEMYTLDNRIIFSDNLLCAYKDRLIGEKKFLMLNSTLRVLRFLRPRESEWYNRRGVTINTRTEEWAGMTLLGIVINQHYIDVASFLLPYANPNQLVDKDETPILKFVIDHYKFSPRHITMMKDLIAIGADVNLSDNKHGRTALHAIMLVKTIYPNDRKEIISLLLASGANPLQKDKYDKTPLSLAEKLPQQEKEQIISMLKEVSEQRK